MLTTQTPTMTPRVFRRRAMNTLFEFALVGDDEEHLAAVADAGFDEIQRVEKLLSRFDPASEVSRVNRHAAAGPVLVDLELLGILLLCRQYWEQTDGRFDIAASGGATFGDVSIDAPRRAVQFTRPGVRLDFGAFGKGYALDRMAGLLWDNGIRQALLHGGTSSVLTLGEPWPVGVRDPWSGGELVRLNLADSALSSSAVFGAGQAASDIVDPRRGRALDEQAGCTVVAPTATEAEMLSTALLAMGRPAATEYCRQHAVRAGWIAQDGGETMWQWLM